MAKGDDSRARNKLDEQQTLAQGYLGGLQSQLAGQYGNLSGQYFGVGPSPTNTFGYGSTVPHFSWTGQPYFQGEGTDTPTRVGSGSTQGATSQRIFDYLKSKGVDSSQELERELPALQRMFPGIERDDSQGPLDELVIPGEGRFDYIRNAETGKPQSLQLMGGPIGSGGGGILGRNLEDYGEISNYFRDFAKTGGLTEVDKQNLRSRALSPIRAAYSDAEREVERGRALQGGYSPGLNAARARMAREQGQLGSDAAGNVEAAITEMVNRNKLSGAGGMASIYGATPGLSNMFGNQVLSSMDQQLRAGGLQNQLGLGLIDAQTRAGQLPGKWQSAMGNIGSTLDVGGQIGGLIYGGMGGGMSPSSAIPGMGTEISPDQFWGSY